MCYPMRAIATKKYKLIRNLAYRLEYPLASDIGGAPSWQGLLKRRDKMMGQRSVAAFLNRPEYELYDLSKDPNELRNLADDAAYAEVLADLRRRLQAWRQETNDPWLILDRQPR